jgi:hypothetical protein
VTVAGSIVDGSAKYAKGSESITIGLRRIFDHLGARVRSLIGFFVEPKASMHLLYKTERR